MSSFLNPSTFTASISHPVSIRRSLVAAFAIAVASSTARAQWGVINLGPGQALATSGNQQVGTDGSGAALWSGSAETHVSLGAGTAVATDGVQQVGGRNNHAALWSGSAGSYVDLGPAIYPISAATGVDGGIQTGYAAHQIGVYACIWTGSEASMVGLNPPNIIQAAALGVSAGQEVGWARWSTYSHACVWTGSAASFVDMHPAGTYESAGLAVHAGNQAGWVTLVSGAREHAALWSGTAASWIDLHPAGTDQSKAYAIRGALQVGEVEIAGQTHASLWSGSAASWVDLQAFLPSGYASSVATGIWTDASGTTYISGYSSGGAVLWVSSMNGSVLCSGDGSGTACPCGNNAAPGANTGCLSSLGVGGKLIAAGVPSVSADTLALLGTQMPNTSMLFFQGTAQVNGGLGSAFGDGLRCAGGTVTRLGTKSGVGGAGHYPVAGDATISVKGVDAPGNVRIYQCWYRNAAAFCQPDTFNLTNAVSVTWTP
jgi:hypothetical protein